MMKKMLLCLGLMGLVSGNVQADMELGKMFKGACVLVGGAWALERIKKSYGDWKRGNPQSASVVEDAHNVIASTACISMFLYFGGAKPETITKTLGSGFVLGSTYMGAKVLLPGCKDLRLREFVAIVATAGVGRELMIGVGGKNSVHSLAA